MKKELTVSTSNGFRCYFDGGQIKVADAVKTIIDYCKNGADDELVASVKIFDSKQAEELRTMKAAELSKVEWKKDFDYMQPVDGENGIEFILDPVKEAEQNAKLEMYSISRKIARLTDEDQKQAAVAELTELAKTYPHVYKNFLEGKQIEATCYADTADESGLNALVATLEKIAAVATTDNEPQFNLQTTDNFKFETGAYYTNEGSVGGAFYVEKISRTELKAAKGILSCLLAKGELYSGNDDAQAEVVIGLIDHIEKAGNQEGYQTSITNLENHSSLIRSELTAVLNGMSVNFAEYINVTTTLGLETVSFNYEGVAALAIHFIKKYISNANRLDECHENSGRCYRVTWSKLVQKIEAEKAAEVELDLQAANSVEEITAEDAEEKRANTRLINYIGFIYETNIIAYARKKIEYQNRNSAIRKARAAVTDIVLAYLNGNFAEQVESVDMPEVAEIVAEDDGSNDDAECAVTPEAFEVAVQAEIDNAKTETKRTAEASAVVIEAPEESTPAKMTVTVSGSNTKELAQKLMANIATLSSIYTVCDGTYQVFDVKTEATVQIEGTAEGTATTLDEAYKKATAFFVTEDDGSNDDEDEDILASYDAEIGGNDEDDDELIDEAEVLSQMDLQSAHSYYDNYEPVPEEEPMTFELGKIYRPELLKADDVLVPSLEYVKLLNICDGVATFLDNVEDIIKGTVVTENGVEVVKGVEYSEYCLPLSYVGQIVISAAARLEDIWGIYSEGFAGAREWREQNATFPLYKYDASWGEAVFKGRVLNALLVKEPPTDDAPADDERDAKAAADTVAEEKALAEEKAREENAPLYLDDVQFGTFGLSAKITKGYVSYRVDGVKTTKEKAEAEYWKRRNAAEEATIEYQMTDCLDDLALFPSIFADLKTAVAQAENELLAAEDDCDKDDLTEKLGMLNEEINSEIKAEKILLDKLEQLKAKYPQVYTKVTGAAKTPKLEEKSEHIETEITEHKPKLADKPYTCVTLRVGDFFNPKKFFSTLNDAVKYALVDKSKRMDWDERYNGAAVCLVYENGMCRPIWKITAEGNFEMVDASEDYGELDNEAVKAELANIDTAQNTNIEKEVAECLSEIKYLNQDITNDKGRIKDAEYWNKSADELESLKKDLKKDEAKYAKEIAKLAELKATYPKIVNKAATAEKEKFGTRFIKAYGKDAATVMKS